MKEDSILFEAGARQEALKEAIRLVKESGQSAELVICRDIPGKHTGGEDCFCDPKMIIIDQDGEIE